jgi:hypothetical protein
MDGFESEPMAHLYALKQVRVKPIVDRPGREE